MLTISSTIIFCEDIREEVGGTASIIGMLGPIVNVSDIPAPGPKDGRDGSETAPSLQRLCVFFCLDIDGADEVEIEFELSVTPSSEIPLPPPLRQKVKNLGIKGLPWRVKTGLQLWNVPIKGDVWFHGRSKAAEYSHEAKLLVRGPSEELISSI